MFAGDDLSVLGRAEQGEEAGLASQGRRALGRGRGGMWPSEARASPTQEGTADKGPLTEHDKPASIPVSQTGSEPGGSSHPYFPELGPGAPTLPSPPAAGLSPSSQGPSLSFPLSLSAEPSPNQSNFRSPPGSRPRRGAHGPKSGTGPQWPCPQTLLSGPSWNKTRGSPGHMSQARCRL